MRIMSRWLSSDYIKFCNTSSSNGLIQAGVVCWGSRPVVGVAPFFLRLGLPAGIRS